MAQLRKRGLSTAVICSTPFERLGQTQAKVFGVPDLPLVMIDHPLGGVDMDGVRIYHAGDTDAIPEMDDLDVDVEFVTTAFAAAVPALVHGECDLIISGLSATPENALFVNFSNVLEAHPVQVLARKSGEVMRSKTDLDREGVTLGVIGDSSVAGLASRSFAKAKVLTFEDDRALSEALAAGKVQAVVAGSPTPELMNRASPNDYYLPLDKGLGLRAEAIAVRRGDDELLNYLNTWIQARRFDGFLGARAEYWFRNMEWARK